MAGNPTESPLVLRESLGSSHNRLTSAEDYEEALLSGYPPVGLLDAKNVYHAEQKGLPRPERRGLRSPWGHSWRSRETAGSGGGASRGSRWRRMAASAGPDHLLRSSSARRTTRSMRSPEGSFFAVASEAAPFGEISSSWSFSKMGFMARSALRKNSRSEER